MKRVSGTSVSDMSCLVSVVVCALICAGLIVASIFMFNTQTVGDKPIVAPTGTVTDPQPNALVTCDNIPMSPDMVCKHSYGNGPGSPYTYDEQKQYQQNMRIEEAKNQRDNRYYDQINARKQRETYGLVGFLSSIIGFVGALFGIATLVGLVMLIGMGWRALKKSCESL